MVAAGEGVGEVAEPLPGAFGVPVPRRAAAVGAFGGAAPVDGRDEARQQVFLQVALGGEARGVEQFPRVPARGVAVHRPGEDDHQRGAQHRGETRARPGPPGPQRAQHLVPQARGPAGAGDAAGGAGQIGREVVEGEIGELDAGRRDQRGVRRAHGPRVLLPAARHHQRHRGGVERPERLAPQALGDLVEAVQDGQDQVGVDEGGGQRGAAGDPARQVRVVAQQQLGQQLPRGGGRRVPGAEAEEDRHPGGRAAGGQQVEGEPGREDRLARARPAEDQQPPGAQAPVGLGDAPHVAAEVDLRRRGPRGELSRPGRSSSWR